MRARLREDLEERVTRQARELRRPRAREGVDASAGAATPIVRPEHILETLCETNRTSRIRINTIYIETERNGGSFLRPQPSK